MNKIVRRVIIGGAAVVAAVLFLSSLIVTYDNEYKLVRQFGKVQRVVSESGISFKLPMIQTLNTIPKDMANTHFKGI